MSLSILHSRNGAGTGEDRVCHCLLLSMWTRVANNRLYSLLLQIDCLLDIQESLDTHSSINNPKRVVPSCSSNYIKPWAFTI